MYRRRKKSIRRLLAASLVIVILSIGIYAFTIAGNINEEQEAGDMLAGIVDTHGSADIKADKSITSAESPSLSAEALSQFFSTISTQLQDEVDRVQGRVGISFLCLTSGTQISIHGDTLFFGASTAKLPRLMRIAELVEEGDLAWEHEIEYRSENIFFAGGTGLLQERIQNGDLHTVGELVRLAATYSDNIAYWMLSHYTVAFENRIQDVFARYLPGETTEGTNHFSANHITSMLNMLYEGLDAIEAYRIIYRHYLASSFRVRLYTPQTGGHVAQVIGSNGAYIHGAGIFSGANPYILTVMTYGVYDAELYISHISNMVWQTMQNLSN